MRNETRIQNPPLERSKNARWVVFIVYIVSMQRPKLDCANTAQEGL